MKCDAIHRNILIYRDTIRQKYRINEYTWANRRKICKLNYVVHRREPSCGIYLFIARGLFSCGLSRQKRRYSDGLGEAVLGEVYIPGAYSREARKLYTGAPEAKEVNNSWTARIIVAGHQGMVGCVSGSLY
jgi:hypothetical protein